MNLDLQSATLYCDASWCPTFEVGGWGIYCRSDNGRFSSSGAIPDYCNDNNTAELAAIFAGLYKICKKWPLTALVYVRSDSTNALNFIVAKDFCERSDVARLQDRIWKLKKDRNLILQMGWVKGHDHEKSVKSWCNMTVDRLARNALQIERSKAVQIW